MSKYLLEPQTFAHGIAKMTPGSGYLDFYDEKLFILSSRGILGYSENLGDEKIEFKQVENNLNLFLNKSKDSNIPIINEKYEIKYHFLGFKIVLFNCPISIMYLR